jgi:prepilin-type N-terminal cleavage/methylation domain-containing protein/prepilin-type processing-associated H-X9-DG protein
MVMSLVGRRQGSRAFTLIEVLVVVAIIALLISILLPSLRIARERAKSVACMSGLRQLGIGAVQYAGANKEYIPPVDNKKQESEFTMAGDVGSDDMRAYYPKYAPMLKIWECPGAGNKVRNVDDLQYTYTSSPDAQLRADRVGGAFEYNPWIYNIVYRPNEYPRYKFAAKPELRMLRLSAVKNAAAVCIMHDNDDSPRNWVPDGDDPHAMLGGGNMGFADGHCDWMNKKYWEDATDKGRPRVRR